MRRTIFARSPGLLFASVDVLSRGLRLDELDHTTLEAQQRLLKLSTGAPSLTYEIQISNEDESVSPQDQVGQVEFGLQTAQGLVIRDGYPFEPQDASQRSFVLEVEDGYYLIRAQALRTLVDGRMRLRLLVRPSSLRVPEHLVDLDYLPPEG